MSDSPSIPGDVGYGKKRPHEPDPAADVLATLLVFIRPGQITELRALGVDGRATYFGYFDHDHLADMARAAVKLEGRAKGVYFVPNPINPELLARCPNRVRKARAGELTKDEDILARRWLLVDADPVRPAGTNSTAAEKAAAREVIDRVHFYLLEEMEADADALVLADSGNGYHLPARIALEAADHGAVRAALLHLAAKFDTDAAKIDPAVFNPARIIKLYGTLTRKGEATAERPYYRSRMIQALPADAGQESGLLASEFVELMADEGRRLPAFKKPQGGGKKIDPFAPLPEVQDYRVILSRAVLYAKKLDPAVSGQKGHNTTLRAASALVNGFRLGAAEALALLRGWNRGCQPPWAERDLVRKIEQAKAKGCGPFGQERGWLLNQKPAKKRAAAPTAATAEGVYRHAS
jgi:hypothetical protein